MFSPCTEIDESAPRTLADYKELALGLLHSMSCAGTAAPSVQPSAVRHLQRPGRLPGIHDRSNFSRISLVASNPIFIIQRPPLVAGMQIDRLKASLAGPVQDGHHDLPRNSALAKLGLGIHILDHGPLGA
jgi:hypothetical protein